MLRSRFVGLAFAIISVTIALTAIYQYFAEEKKLSNVEIARNSPDFPLPPESMPITPADTTENLIPEKYLSFVPEGYTARGYQDGDITGDGESDLILVLSKNSLPEGGKHRVDLLARQSYGLLVLESSNRDLFDDFQEEGMLDGQRIEPDPSGKGFIITDSGSGAGASSTYFISKYYFVYRKKEKQWFLEKAVHETGLNSPAVVTGQMIDRKLREMGNYTVSQKDSIVEYYERIFLDAEPEIIVKTPKDFGKITFPKFDLVEVRGY